MLGCKSGFDALMKTLAPNSIGTHYAVHRQVLATETHHVQAVNFIKSGPFNSRIFKILYFETKAKSTKLSLHTERSIRWLSKGKIFKRT
jgi:hypothetical protein